VKSTTRTTTPSTDVKVSSKFTRLLETAPISERIVSS
jgi:hypothetical protein